MAVSFINSAFREWMQWKTMWYICDTKWTEQNEWMNERTYERTCRYSSAINTNTYTHSHMWVCMQPYERFMEHVSLFRSVCVRPCVCVCACVDVRSTLCNREEERSDNRLMPYHMLCSTHSHQSYVANDVTEMAHTRKWYVVVVVWFSSCCFYGQINVMHLIHKHKHIHTDKLKNLW